MGCGVSRSDLRSASCTEVQRHPSDLGLEYCELIPTQLLAFDTTFSECEQVLNHLIELNNDVNDCIADVKSAYATCVSNLQLSIQVQLDTDQVQLDVLSSSKRGRPHPTDLRALLQDDKQLQAADEALQKAHTQLHSMLMKAAQRASAQHGGLLQMTHSTSSVATQGPNQSSNHLNATQPPGHVQLSMSGDGNELHSDPELFEVASFNQHLQTFRHCLGSKYQVKMSIKHSRAPGTPTIGARILKPSPSHELQVAGWFDASATAAEPASLLDLATIEMEGAVDIIKDAESALVHKTQWLSGKIKELSSVQWQVLRRHKVTLALIIPDPERRTLIRKALVDINAALYALVSCTANPDGHGTLAGAVGEVARQLCLVLRKRWENRGGLPMPLKKLLTVTTSLSFKEAGVFEFTVHAEALPQAQLGVFPSCLPIPGQELLARIEMLSGTIANALQQLPNISSQIGHLTEHARDFYDMVPEAAAQKGLPMMEAVKAGKAVGTNLELLFSSERLFHAFAANVKRVADDLARAQEEVDSVIAQQADIATYADKST